MSKHTIVRESGVNYISANREAGRDAARSLQLAAQCAADMADHYTKRSESEERDEWAAEYRELAEYLEASHARLVARRLASHGVNEPATPRRYDCPCGFGMVDGSDDVDGFYEEVADHEQTCDGMPVAGPEDDEDDDEEWVLGAPVAELTPEDLPDEPTTDRACEHTDAHHGVAGTELNGCDECGATWAADWIVESFRPPADAEPYDGGRIPDVEPRTVSDYCPTSFFHRHEWMDGEGWCMACSVEEPVSPPVLAYSQAGLMSLVGSR